MLAASVRALVHVEGSSSLALQEVIARARPLSHGRQRVYNAVVSAFAHNRHAEGRVERVLSLIEQMKREGVRPSSFTLQHVFIAARGESTSSEDLLDLMVSQMRQGLRPSRAVFDRLLEACPLPASSDVQGPNRLPVPVPVLLQVMSLCQFKPSGTTVRALLSRVRSPVDLTALRPVLVRLPPMQRRALEK